MLLVYQLPNHQTPAKDLHVVLYHLMCTYDYIYTCYYESVTRHGIPYV